MSFTLVLHDDRPVEIGLYYPVMQGIGAALDLIPTEREPYFDPLYEFLFWRAGDDLTYDEELALYNALVPFIDEFGARLPQSSREIFAKIMAIISADIQATVREGDYEGHPFRGNQWTDGMGGGEVGPATGGSEVGQKALGAGEVSWRWAGGPKKDTSPKDRPWARHEAVRQQIVKQYGVHEKKLVPLRKQLVELHQKMLTSKKVDPKDRAVAKKVMEEHNAIQAQAAKEALDTLALEVKPGSMRIESKSFKGAGKSTDPRAVDVSTGMQVIGEIAGDNSYFNTDVVRVESDPIASETVISNRGDVVITIGTELSNVQGAKFMHEQGHALEDLHYDVHAAAVDLLKRRTDGQEMKRGNQILLGEAKGKAGGYYRPDEFAVPYAGRDYSLNESLMGAEARFDLPTEIISTGMEMMRTNPGLFAATDPEHFKLTLWAMRGATGNHRKADKRVARFLSLGMSRGAGREEEQDKLAKELGVD